jgi:hypothetical protein
LKVTTPVVALMLNRDASAPEIEYLRISPQNSTQADAEKKGPVPF